MHSTLIFETTCVKWDEKNKVILFGWLDKSNRSVQSVSSQRRGHTSVNVKPGNRDKDIDREVATLVGSKICVTSKFNWPSEMSEFSETSELRNYFLSCTRCVVWYDFSCSTTLAQRITFVTQLWKAEWKTNKKLGRIRLLMPQYIM